MAKKSPHRLASFSFAFRGLLQLFRSEPNARIHLAFLIIITILGLLFEISFREWAFLILCFGLVFIAELFNTALELLCDHVTPEWHGNIERVKDVSAAAVLISAITAALVGLIIFVPHILSIDSV
jgi:undecaprenol kinase/diacylglycerol kinase (ATP)